MIKSRFFSFWCQIWVGTMPMILFLINNNNKVRSSFFRILFIESNYTTILKDLMKQSYYLKKKKKIKSKFLHSWIKRVFSTTVLNIMDASIQEPNKLSTITDNVWVRRAIVSQIESNDISHVSSISSPLINLIMSPLVNPIYHRNI